MMIALTMLTRSHSDQTKVTYQKSAFKSLSVAESAVTNYQSLLNNNRPLATYCSQASDESPACQTGVTWDVIDEQTLEGPNACSTGGALVTTIQASAGTSWKNLEEDNPERGQYRLISYTYEPDDPSEPNKAPGTGILIVEGRVNQIGSGATAEKDGSRTATTRIRAEIPVIQPPPPDDPIPGVWLQSGTTGSKNTVKGNVFLSDCDVTDSERESVNVAEGYQVQQIGWAFPRLPDKPTGINDLSDLSSDVTLPRIGTDQVTTKDIDGETVEVYEYAVDSIASNATITISSGSKVIFYLDGDIAPSGNGTIVHSCTDSNGNPIEGCNFTDFQIYGYGDLGSKICLHGNHQLEAFILAPNYTVGIAGSGDDGGIKGSVWAYDWSTSSSCGSNTENTVVTQTAEWDQMITGSENLPPRIQAVSSWERETVED
jgi:hypothetical protein